MSKLFARSFYASREWKQTRKAYISSVFGLCQRCRGIGHILHHIKPLNPDNINNPEISLSWDNLMFVCKDCHEKLHSNGGDVVREDVMFDSTGQLVRR